MGGGAFLELQGIYDAGSAVSKKPFAAKPRGETKLLPYLLLKKIISFTNVLRLSLIIEIRLEH